MREQLVKNTAVLKETPAYDSVFVKRDTHPAIRQEWSRMHKAFKEEKERPENAGCNIVFDKKYKIIKRDGVIIDRWRKPVFF
jgi:hypothetical protein